MGVVCLVPAMAMAAPPQHAKLSAAVVNLSALQPGQQAVAAIVLDVNEGFHAQSHTPSQPEYIKFVAKVDPSDAVTLYDPVYPPGEEKEYGSLGKLNVYTGRVIVYVPLQVKAGVGEGPVKISGTLRYQVCDDNVCYPPSKTPFTIESKVVAAGQSVEPQNPELFQGFDFKIFSKLGAATQPAATQPSSAQGSSGGGNGSFSLFGHEVTDHSYGLVFVAAFLVGIVFNAVPCVLPVLPLKAIGFYEVSQHNRAKSLAFGAMFSAGLIASFGVLALLVVVFRVLAWGELYSNAWFSLGIVAILLVMAVSTFGFFTVNLPPAVYSITPRHDTYVGNFLFGILTAVLSTPCTFGMFLGLLVWATRQPAAIGTAMLMTVGAGMASPYLALSAFPEVARRFPRTGPWSEVVKQMMGFLLLGTAIYFARRFLSPITGVDGFWWVLFGLSVVAAGFLIIRTLAITSEGAAPIVAMIIAVAIVAPAFYVTRTLAAQPYQWKPYSADALSQARSQRRVVVVEFTASWCSNCQYLESFVLHDKAVVSAVKNNDVEMLKADLTQDDAAGWPLLKKLNPIAAIPFTAVYRPSVDEPQRLTGIYSTTDLKNAIAPASTASSLSGESSVRRGAITSIPRDIKLGASENFDIVSREF